MTPMPSPLPTRTIPEGILPTDLDYFSSLALAKSTVSDPNFELIPLSRTLTPDGLGHTLMASTWNSPSTIPHLLTFYRPTLRPAPSATASTECVMDKNIRTELRRFYTFGSGLNSHANLLHGGVLSTVIDSTMSNMAGLALREVMGYRDASVVTAQLTVTFLAAVRTPGSVRVRAWASRIEADRKVWVEAVVEREAEDSEKGAKEGVVCVARGEGLWIRIGKNGKL